VVYLVFPLKFIDVLPFSGKYIWWRKCKKFDKDYDWWTLFEVNFSGFAWSLIVFCEVFYFSSLMSLSHSIKCLISDFWALHRHWSNKLCTEMCRMWNFLLDAFVNSIDYPILLFWVLFICGSLWFVILSLLSGEMMFCFGCYYRSPLGS